MLGNLTTGGNLVNVGAAGGGSLIVPTFGTAFLSVGGDVVAPGGRIAVGESMPGKDYAGRRRHRWQGDRLGLCGPVADQHQCSRP